MICPRCQETNFDSARYCVSCGQSFLFNDPSATSARVSTAFNAETSEKRESGSPTTPKPTVIRQPRSGDDVDVTVINDQRSAGRYCTTCGAQIVSAPTSFKRPAPVAQHVPEGGYDEASSRPRYFLFVGLSSVGTVISTLLEKFFVSVFAWHLLDGDNPTIHSFGWILAAIAASPLVAYYYWAVTASGLGGNLERKPSYAAIWLGAIWVNLVPLLAMAGAWISLSAPNPDPQIVYGIGRYLGELSVFAVVALFLCGSVAQYSKRSKNVV